MQLHMDFTPLSQVDRWRPEVKSKTAFAVVELFLLLGEEIIGVCKSSSESTG
jgi:hypothetical protein